MNKHENQASIFGISFDGVPMSGIVVEFLKIAEIFHRNKYRIYFDPGYEIKADKQNFFKPFTDTGAIFPDWLHLIKSLKKPFKSYSPKLVSGIMHSYIHNQEQETYESIINEYSDFIAEKLVELWHDLNVHVVIVENGTLPENLIFTHALYKAISLYGGRRNLGKFVIWRDHDLMWSSETSSQKYGKPPYPNVPNLIRSRHISYVVLHEADLIEARKWCPNAELAVLKNNFSSFMSFEHNNDTDSVNLRRLFREAYHIPDEAYLIARFTRIIPQKRIDRDIFLLHYLHELNTRHTHPSRIYLCIAGDPNENPDEYAKLLHLIHKFHLDKFVVFTGPLKPVGIEMPDDIKSIKNLILASDICSFLTSYDYESFGNPISEAIGFGKPYITTTYKRYQQVYGDAGYKGIELRVSPEQDASVNSRFASEVFRLLLDQDKTKSIIRYNRNLLLKSTATNRGMADNVSRLLNIKLS